MLCKDIKFTSINQYGYYENEDRVNFKLKTAMIKFVCLCTEGAGGIMFSGCPSVRPYISLTRYLENPLTDFDHICPRCTP